MSSMKDLLARAFVQENPSENVMLLAMSTFPRASRDGSYSVNTYYAEDGNQKQYFKGLAQLEAHTKYVLYQLAGKGVRLDRIVILASEKTRTQGHPDWGGETAVSHYIKQIERYCRGQEPEIPEGFRDPNSRQRESRIHTGLYAGNQMPSFETVELEHPLYFWDAVMKITGGRPETAVHLYMDMQGGDRNTFSQMNAIVTLLNHVTIKGRYANDFEPGKTMHRIREVSGEYRTYELVSAMEIFKKYGWGDKLEQYFQGNLKSSSREAKLLKAIKQASSAISKCNVDGFDSAVDRIEKLQEEFKNPQKVTELDVVYQDIRNDYRPLFGAPHRYVAQIRWCLDRSFLQQAITIFEAKMPHEFICSGLIYYLTEESTEEEKRHFLETCGNIYQRLKEENERECYRMKDINHYLIREYCCGYPSQRRRTGYTDPEHLLTFGLGERRKGEVLSLMEEYRRLCGLRNQINHVVTGKQKEGFFSYMKSRYPEDGNWKEKQLPDFAAQLRDYLDRWENLASEVPEGIHSLDYS